MTFDVYLNTLKQKGYLAYEYNPFLNYQTDVNLYLVDKKFIVPEGQAVNLKNGELLTKKNEKWVDKRGEIKSDATIIDKDISTYEEGELLYRAGSVIDLDTDKLNFDLDHPVEIEVQPSYDGSVNLILNDDKNIPRIINSRFSVREKNTYEIVDRIGENDTNIYSSNTFDKDTSLYFQYEYNPIIEYKGFIQGKLPVGQYCFYLTYCDADDNESDYITESGVIPVFIGSDKDPFSIDGGIKNQNSNKGIKLKLSNLDKSYNYLRVYYVRYFADYQQNRVYECKKLYQRYPIKSNFMYLQITGDENTEDLDANILNITRFNPKSILTQAQCKNMLFFGNIVKNSDNYRELQDCALRIIPSLKIETLNQVNNRYVNTKNSYGYYDSLNIYNKTGYFDQEFYRFGVVFIYQNGTLSNVYNTLGYTISQESNVTCKNSLYSIIDNGLLKRNYINCDEFGWIESSEYYNGSPQFTNGKGVCKIDAKIEDDNTIIGIKFNFPEDKTFIKHLKEDLGIRGLFFVRQKCVPTILAQCYLMPMDEELEAPVLRVGTNDYYSESFLVQKKSTSDDLQGNEQYLRNNYNQRLYKYKRITGGEAAISKKAYAAICPDFLLNQPYYNQIFNGGKFKLEKISGKSYLANSGDRFYYEGGENPNIEYKNTNILTSALICTVTENVNTVALKDKVYRLEIGECEEAYRFRWAEVDNGTYDSVSEKNKKSVNNATNLVRGKYSPYLAIYSDSKLDTSCLYNIYQDGILDIKQEYQNRINSSEPFYAISDRYNFENINNNELTCWRGDCYLNTFTYRLNRNFNDPTLPNNDEIIDPKTWKNNYDAFDQTKWTKISRSDVNAVQLGSWITIKVRSAMNYALRSVDHSYVSEEALMGAPRSFYPRSSLLWRGENKMPDSYLFNDAYRQTLGFKCYFTLQDVNYIKDTFSNRIQYSAISIQDSYKNNYRYSLSTYFRDYSQEYGSIVKLVSFEGYLLVVFEHAIGVAVINERILAGTGDGEPVFINTKNVLPEELTIITDTYGTQWGDSVVKSEAGYVYGVDTIAKKIWRVKGQQLEILSDFKVNKFLVDNITLGERELYPTIGLRNVKTHYNNNKKDIMFTFYDDVYKDEEKVWNLCYNELLGEFVTFYSWVPSFSENIDTQFFTFDRNTAKGLSLLSKSNYNIPENNGILLDTPILDDNYETDIHYKDVYEDIRNQVTVQNPDGTTYIKKNLDANEYKNPPVSFNIEKDHWGNYKLFKIEDNKLKVKDIVSFTTKIKEQKGVMLLEITPIGENNIVYPTETVALTTENYVNGMNFDYNESKKNYKLTTDFYIHGQAGIFNVKESLSPTYWYGEIHPFEFEFVVNESVGQQKIFNNLIIVSNKAEPESFHFEIEGDNYEFSSDKRNMYFRQEATKELFQNLGSNITFDRKYTDVQATRYTQEQYYRAEDSTIYKYNLGDAYPVENENLTQQIKSTIFPLYYERNDTFYNIYDDYKVMNSDKLHDFVNLSGSEIKWDKDLNQFNIVTHIKNSPIDRVGRLRGNSLYKEGKWEIQIPSIIFNQKNEDKWIDNKPYLVINSSNVPNDLQTSQISVDKLPNIYDNNLGYIQVGDWTARKEARIRDKWIKIRVRYSGKNLAVIHSLITLFNISYA